METILVLILIVLSVCTAYLYKKYNDLKKVNKEELSEIDAIEKASELAKKSLLDANQRIRQLEIESQKNIDKSKRLIQEKEQKIIEKEKTLTDKSNALDLKLSGIEKELSNISEEKNNLKEKELKIKSELEKVASLTQKEAEEQLKNEVQKDLDSWRSKKIKESEELVRDNIDELRKKIIIDAIHSVAVDYIAEATSTTIDIEDESMKSRVIGKQGRNIRAFEKITGIDIIIDEAPNEITISSFDPIRREVGRIALQSLLKSGKINPSTIEETVLKVKKDLLRTIKQVGEKIAIEAGFNDLDPDLIMVLGRFKYRFGEGQNLARHTLEVVQLGEYLAREMKVNVRITKLACLLHDAGKVIPEDGKRYFEISAELAQKFFPEDKVLYSILAEQENEVQQSYLEGEILKLANIISSNRPGAKRETYEEYIKRMRSLEDIAYKQKGVVNAFAIKAGSEVCIYIEPEKVGQHEMSAIAYDIAKKIEESQNYVGNIKVKLVREFRAQSEAK